MSRLPYFPSPPQQRFSRLSLRCTGDQATGAASAHPLLYKGDHVLPNPRRPAASPAASTLGPGHGGRLCGRAAVRPGGPRALAEHLLPGAGAASCVREKLPPLPLPGPHACVRSAAPGGEEADTGWQPPPGRSGPCPNRFGRAGRAAPQSRSHPGGGAGVLQSTARLLFCIFGWNGCVTERKEPCPLKQEVPSSSVLQTLSNRQTSRVTMNVKHQDTNQGPDHPAQEGRVLAVIHKQLSPRQPGSARLPTAGFRLRALRTRKQPPSSPGFPQDAFHTGFDLRAAP